MDPFTGAPELIEDVDGEIVEVAAPRARDSERVARHRAAVTKIIDTTLAGNGAWKKLEYLTDRIGHRLSGSKALEKAVAWAVKTT